MKRRNKRLLALALALLLSVPAGVPVSAQELENKSVLTDQTTVGENVTTEETEEIDETAEEITEETPEEFIEEESIGNETAVDTEDVSDEVLMEELPVIEMSGDEQTNEKEITGPVEDAEDFIAVIGANSGEEEQIGIITILVEKEYYATIIKWDYDAELLIIPDFLGDYKVIGIGDGVFKGNTKITTLLMPDSLESIGTGTFKNCSNLKNVYLSKGLTTIGQGAFENCDALQTTTVNGSGSIGSRAFYDCDALTDLTISDKVTGNPPPCLRGWQSIPRILWFYSSFISRINRASAFPGCGS